MYETVHYVILEKEDSLKIKGIEQLYSEKHRNCIVQKKSLAL